MNLLAITTSLTLSTFVGATTLQANETNQIETPAQTNARMAWWREAKFGMFIHWGVYSVPAGYYHGKPVPDIGEWIMNHGKIPMVEYQEFAKEFNPMNFNADAWVEMAKEAGMKYIIITSKHHDGFAMFQSKASKWNIYDATPWHHDPLRELAVACQKNGIKLGFYYSQAQDWNNGGAATGGKWDPAQQHDMDDYVDHVAVPQVKEICSNYGSDVPAIIWWDTGNEISHQQAEKLYQTVKELKPNIIMNDRLGGGFRGDTVTPEQHIPPRGYPDRNWETCMTINDTWGFKRDDNNWKSSETLIRDLCDIASKGGNYLLNVGPTAQGVIPPPEAERLAQIGRWMKVNGEAIYGSSPTPFGAEAGRFSEGKEGKPKFISAWDWRCTSKPGKLYLLIFNWPATGQFELQGLQSKVNKAYLLVGHASLHFAQTAEGVILDLPKIAPDKIASVVCLELADAIAKVNVAN